MPVSSRSTHRPAIVLAIAFGIALATRSASLVAEPARPIVIAHRGASGYRPEHTLEAYQLAIEQGADYIEPDVVMTRDGELLARHDALLARVELDASGQILRRNGRPVIDAEGTSTNVWLLPQYADRLRVREIDGHRVGGWFVEDFTAAEIRADVRAQERLAEVRPANTGYNNLYGIPTLQEVIDLASERKVGVYVETKHPSHFREVSEANGLPRMEDRLVEALHRRFGNRRDTPVYIQSFEVANLQYLNRRTELRLVQLMTPAGQPRDFTLNHDVRTYADLASSHPQGLPFVNLTPTAWASTPTWCCLSTGTCRSPRRWCRTHTSWDWRSISGRSARRIISCRPRSVPANAPPNSAIWRDASTCSCDSASTASLRTIRTWAFRPWCAAAGEPGGLVFQRR